MFQWSRGSLFRRWLAMMVPAVPAPRMRRFFIKSGGEKFFLQVSDHIAHAVVGEAVDDAALLAALGNETGEPQDFELLRGVGEVAVSDDAGDVLHAYL